MFRGYVVERDRRDMRLHIAYVEGFMRRRRHRRLVGDTHRCGALSYSFMRGNEYYYYYYYYYVPR